MDTKELETENLHNCPPSKSNEITRSCIDCHTTKTPCWRSGPAGPRTLCNACGIRYRKESRVPVAFDRAGADRSKRKIGKTSSSSSKLGVSLKLGLMGYGRESAGLQRDWRRKLGEEEQAAMLLMALSCGSFYS